MPSSPDEACSLQKINHGKTNTMLRFALLLFSFILSFASIAQELGSLTVEKIMRDPKWIGTSPSNPFWSHDGTMLYFQWNPEKNLGDSTYYITVKNFNPVKASVEEKQSIISASNAEYNKARTTYTYSKDGDVFYVNLKSNRTIRITQTTESESNPQFSFNETRIVYHRNSNLYSWDIQTGETIQLTNTGRSSERSERRQNESSRNP